MIHLGDITKVHGHEIPLVDCITGGSPCQDLSVAGKRAGLGAERSGLFMEQIRIVKEMRQRDRNSGRTGYMVRPRFMVWENAPGAFTSNGGKDFQAVLTEICRVADPECPDVPMPDKGGGGSKAGCLYGELGDWSVAWRVHDAQFWGVPQRRKRIALVADFGGLSAPEILFERKGMSWDSDTSGTARQEASRTAGKGAESAGGTYDIAHTLSARYDGSPQPDKGSGANIICANPWDSQSGRVYSGDVWHGLSSNSGGGQSRDAYLQTFGIDQQGGKGNAGYTENVAPTLAGDSHGTPHAVAYGISPFDSEGMKSANPRAGIYEADTSRTLDVGGGNPSCNQGGMAIVQCYDARGNGDGNTVPTLTGDHQNRVTDYTAIIYQEVTGPLMASGYSKLGTQEAANDMYVATMQGFGDYNLSGVASACKSRDYKDATDLVFGKEVAAVDCRNGTENPDTNGTLQAKESGGQSINYQNTIRHGAAVRRLTPLECERLQGYPDGWTDIGDWVDSKGKKHKAADSPRYKALGNSIALPFWFWLLRRISAQYERPATLGSLFDGIGGFPLCWERCNGKGTAVWASEIEKFCIAVTKRRFE